MKLLSKLIFEFFLILLFSKSVLGAACCGGGYAAPSLISSDDKAQITTSLSAIEVVVDNVDTQGVWRKWDDHQKVQKLNIEGAHIFDDLWQVGFSIPVLRRSNQFESSSGLGDSVLSLGYEYLPDWNYNPLRPKGIGFLQITLPTGKSRADAEDTGIDSRGNGFWALGLGTLLTKAIGPWDFFTSIEIHRSFGKDFQSPNFSGTLEPGFGGNVGAGLGYNFKEYRFGSSITWSYEDPIHILANDGFDQSGSVERFATAVLSASYLANDDWSGTLSYSDQTWFGSPLNTSLGRGLALQLQRRWGR